ncbi:hypothetical protein QAD02_022175 [Eretmocerus hayati]|uniref:Uncharacterized protein n=1 Tax=Eretmocerus hayati TaxID=131215 RepID=A0ACC2PUC9_9HYME|nr:hypothetical protein QAD02_022175 [Eretmocerus hayati]
MSSNVRISQKYQSKPQERHSGDCIESVNACEFLILFENPERRDSICMQFYTNHSHVERPPVDCHRYPLQLTRRTFSLMQKLNLLSPSIQNVSSQPHFGLLFDIDGVLVRGKQVIPCAPEGFKRLVKSNNEFRVPTVFVTNSGNTIRSEKAADLTRVLGVPITEDQVILSHTPLRAFKEYQDKRLLFSGQGDVHKIALELGFTNIVTMEEVVRNFPSLDYVNKDRRKPHNGPLNPDFKKIDGIVLVNEPINWETSLQLLVDLLITNGMPSAKLADTPFPHMTVMACNVDLLWVSEAPIERYGHGAFLHCLECLYKKVTGKELVYTALIGKPSILTYCYANDKIAEHARKIGISPKIETLYAIGDNINTDVYGANLYNNFLKTEKYGNSPSYSSAILKNIQKSESRAKTCSSILVETGVHHKDSKFLERHSHATFMPLDKRLLTPSFISQDVSCAIDTVFEKENFK